MADRGYQLVIGANFVGKTYAYLYLDTCMEKDITSSAHIPTQPLQNGNTIADHMYRNPDEYTISGVFSLYGKYGNDKRYDNMPIISDQGDRLGNIQSVFEYIKDNGILCDLTTIQEDDYGTVRFKQRTNMALESIRWKENQASMNYTFTFKEIMCVEVQQDIAKSDPDLPNIYAPSARSLGQILMETGENGQMNPYAKLLLYSLIKNGYIEDAWDRETAIHDKFIKHNNQELLAIIAAISSFAVGGVVGGLFGFQNIINTFNIEKNWNKTYKTVHAQDNVFKLITNTEKYIDPNTGRLDIKAVMQDPNCELDLNELRRLNDLLIKVKNEIINTISDCTFYSISSGKDDNEPREVVLNIGSNTYYVAFNKDPESFYGWKLDVTTPGYYEDYGEVSLDGTNGWLYNDWAVCTSFDEMNSETMCIFKDATLEYEVYLYNDLGDKDSRQSLQNRKDQLNYLCNYQLVVSYGHIKDHIQKIYDTINDALVKEYYN